ncbi:MAG: FKBP-type peptidyl-prolyl cis-trans isomerase [Nocardioides sp.]
MRRRFTVALLVSLSIALAGCGADSESGAKDDTGLDPITVTGAFGASPEVKFSDQLVVQETTSKVLEEGDGAKVAKGDTVLTQIVLANGFSQQVLYNSYNVQAQLLKVDDTLAKGLKSALLDHTIGSRVMVAAPPKDAYGPSGNAQLGVGNTDTVIYIVDLLSTVAQKLEGTAKPLPAGLPKLVETDGIITGWDFAGSDKPDGKLHVYPLIEGDGPKVTAKSTVVTRYLGQVYGGKKPFDGNYSAPDPATFAISGLVKGWQQGLEGVASGSRVVIVVPPALGYGEAGNEGAGISGTDTLYFVLDILGTT